MSLVNEFFRTAIERASAGEFGYTATLESMDNHGAWVQLSWDKINAAFPFDTPPLEIFDSLSLQLPSFAEVSEWAPHKFVTIEHGAEPLEDLIAFVENYLKMALDSPIDQVRFRTRETL